ncbi:uncharacterized protein LOC27207007 isoform X2 [Drosophila simulans]|nr:uncharacterized protein LOC27207007 isoform X2 [Drosophila simulans]
MWPVVPSMGQGQPVQSVVLSPSSALSACLQQVTRRGICICRAKELLTCGGRATCVQVGVCMCACALSTSFVSAVDAAASGQRRQRSIEPSLYSGFDAPHPHPARDKSPAYNQEKCCQNKSPHVHCVAFGSPVI